jgi:serine/threonine protein kinase/WD40 repeat protein/tetratricopeptide (TPR) repeat protein
MTTSEADRNPVEKLAEEFAERYRRGERPSLTEFVERYPELADDIRDLFPALVKMEQLKPAAADGTGPYGNSATAAPAPDRVGDYRILREVGRGGMGVVYEAEQLSLGRHVALKVLPTFGLINPVFLERFRREAKAAARLHHTNIVPVFGVGESDGLHYYAMQFIQGEGLDKVLHDLRRFRDGPGALQADRTLTVGNMTGSVAQGLWTGRFVFNDELLPTPKTDGPPTGHDAADPAAPASRSELTNRTTGEYFRSVARVGMQVAEALAYAHKQGILHRDIKPSNLLLDQQGAVWVTDFGLAKAEGSDELTHTGDIVGTLRFMAPERFDGASLPQSDVYGLGLTLYEMLSLRPAFEDANRARLIDRILHDPPAPLRRYDSRTPRDLETIVLKAIAKDPVERYAAAEDMAADLGRFLADRPIYARRAGTTERLWRWCRRNPMVAGLTAAVMLLVVVIAIGSSVAAIRLGSALRRSEMAEREGKHKLFESYVSEADATRMSGQVGQRFGALARVRDALAISQETGLGAADRLRLRNVAIAALCRPDVAVDLKWPAGPDQPLPAGLDPALRRLLLAERAVAQLPPPAYRFGYRCWYSPDGRFVAVQTQSYIDGKRQFLPARVWRIDGAAPRLVLEDAEATRLVDFRPDGSEVAFGLADNTAQVFGTETGKRLRRLDPGAPGITNLAYHPSLPRLAAVQGNDVVIWDTETGRQLLTLHTPAAIHNLAWHPRGHRLATTNFTRGIELWDTETGRMLAEPPMVGRGGCAYVAFDRAGEFVASGDGPMLRIWDAATGRHLFSFHSDQSLEFGWNDHTSALRRVGDRYQTLRIATGQELRVLHRPTPQGAQRFETLALHPAGRLLAATTQAGLGFFDLLTGEELQFIPGSIADVRGFDRSGALWTAGTAGLLRWPVQQVNAATDRLRIGPPEWVADIPGRLWSCGFSADGRVAAVPLGSDGTLVVHRGDSRRTLRLGPQYDVRGVAVSPDGRWIVSGSHWNDGSGIRYKVWGADSGKLLASLPFPNVDDGFGFSADSRWLYVANEQGRWLEMSALAAADGVPGQTSPESPTGDSIKPRDVVSRDHRLRAEGSDEGVVRLVAFESGEEIARLPTPEVGHVTPDLFSADGSRLLARGGESGSLYVFDLGRIRDQLADLGLDWGEARPTAPTRTEGGNPAIARLLSVELVDGEWAASRAKMGRYERQRVALGLFVNPFDADAEYRLGELQIRGNQFADAYTHLSAALAFRPDLVGAYRLRAQAGYYLKRWDDSVADAERYLKLFPYDNFAHVLRAAANHGRHHDAEAVADLTTLIEAYPQQAQLYRQRAACYEALGKADLAAVDRARADKLGPEDSEELNEQAWLLVTGPKEHRDSVKAIALARRAIALRPDQPMYRNTLGVAQYRHGDYVPAIESLEKSLALGKGQFDAFDLYFLAMCHKKLGHAGQAKDCFNRGVRWAQQHQNQLEVGVGEELTGFQAEAEAVLKEP